MNESQRVGGATASLPISIRSVSKRYGSFTALDGVDLEIESGEFVTLLGPSGSGKTTLLMVLAGFIRPDSGTVLFGDRDVSLVPPHRRDVGMVFQNYALFPHMSVAGNVAYPLKLRGSRRTKRPGASKMRSNWCSWAISASAASTNSLVANANVWRWRAPSYSSRASFWMDEPLSALDKKLREQMQIEVRHLHQRLGMTTVYGTHDQREALTMSDRIAVIDRGNFRQIGKPRDIYERPESRFIADFIGESQFLPVEIRDGKAVYGGHALVSERVPDASRGAHLLVVRPEKLLILGPGAGAG